MDDALRIGLKMYREYLNVKSLIKRDDLDPEVKSKLKSFLEAFEEYMVFISNHHKKIESKLEHILKRI